MEYTYEYYEYDTNYEAVQPMHTLFYCHYGVHDPYSLTAIELALGWLSVRPSKCRSVRNDCWCIFDFGCEYFTIFAILSST